MRGDKKLDKRFINASVWYFPKLHYAKAIRMICLLSCL